MTVIYKELFQLVSQILFYYLFNKLPNWLKCVCVVSGKQGQCLYHGLTMFDQAVWSPKPCLTCLCTGGRVVCDRVTCPMLPCHYTVTPPGECCPVCMEPGRNTTCGDAMVQHQEATEMSNVSDNQRCATFSFATGQAGSYVFNQTIVLLKLKWGRTVQAENMWYRVSDWI